MSTKQELLTKFASQTGAEIPGVQSKLNQLKIDPLSDNIAESNIVPNEELFKDSFTDRTKIPPWQNPKYKAFIVSLCVIPAALAVALIFKDGVPKPKMETKAPNSAPVTQELDDMPKSASDGEWASYASTNGMHQQFANAAETENADELKKFQERTNKVEKKVPGRSLTAKPITQPVPTTPTTHTNISTNGASTYPYARVYAPPAHGTVVVPVARSVNSSLLAKHSPIFTDNSRQSGGSPQQQQSPQERITAILAATSTEDNSERAAEAPAAISTQSEVVLPQPVNTPDQMVYLPSEAAVIDGQPQTLIDRNQSAKGILLTGIAFTSEDYASLANQPVEVELSEALGDIPAGARIVAVIDAKDNHSSNGKSKVVRLKPTALAVGNMEIPLPNEAMALSGKNGKPLIAKKRGSTFLKVLGGLAGTVAGGATMTNFGAAQNVQIGNSSYFKSIGANIATSLVSNAAQQIQQSQEGYNRVLSLKAGSSIVIAVRKPIALPVSVIQEHANIGDTADAHN